MKVLLFLYTITILACSRADSERTANMSRDVSFSANAHPPSLDSGENRQTEVRDSEVGDFDAIMMVTDDEITDGDLASSEFFDMTIPDPHVERDQDIETVETGLGEVPQADGERTGQCNSNQECGGENGYCSRALPGGACMGCMGDSDCPGESECSSMYGSVCISPCNLDADCHPGLYCSGSTGRCRALECVDGECPDARFGCNDSHLCERQSCSDEMPCPLGTACDRGLCVLDIWVP